MSLFSISRIAVLAAIGLLVSCGEEAAEPMRQPTVILITAGDIALEDLSPYGGPIAMPNLDRLAAMGTVFDRAYSASTQAGPARAALATGQYPQRFGFHYDMGTVRESLTAKSGIPDDITLLPARLQSFGYTTMLFGSWQLGAAPPFYPMFRGYDVFWGTLGANTSYTVPRRADTSFARTAKYRLPPSRSRFNTIFTGEKADTVPNTSRYLTDDMGDEVAREIARAFRADALQPQAQAATPSNTPQASARKPFFLWAAFHAPREPLTAIKADMEGLESLGSKNRQVYGGMIKALDRNIGKILDALEAQGALEDTMIIFTADRGCDSAAQTCPCGTLRGGAPTFREGGLRVPLIISMPSTFQAGSRLADPVISMDIPATIIALSDPEQRLVPELDGVDLTRTLKDPSKSMRKRILFWDQFPFSAAIRGTTKILLDGTSSRAKLYDLAADPGELEDGAEEDFYTVSEIETKLDLWRDNNTIPAWEGYKSAPMQICGREEHGLQ